MDYEEKYHELYEMLIKARAEIKALIWKEVGKKDGDGSHEHNRLTAKLSGINLAIEYMQQLDDDEED